MGVLEILILVAIAIVVYIVIRRLPDTRSGISSAVGGGTRMIGKSGTNLAVVIKNLFGGVFGSIIRIIRKTPKKNLKTSSPEALDHQLKKPEDRDFWIQEENSSPVTNHALISKTYFDEAEEAFKQKDYRKAEALFIEAARENPKNAKIFNRLGVIYLEQKNYEDAIDSFSTAIKHDDSVCSRYYNLALAYAGQGNYKSAVSSMKSAIKLSPNNEKYKQVLEQMEKKC